MAPDFKTYLATEVISEQKIVSYRKLSRALKVHVNAAKCMLYEFYERERKKKAGSIYATYLIAGTKKKVELTTVTDGDTADTNGDVAMPSSPPPFPSSMADSSQRTTHTTEEVAPVPVKTITLVAEDGLEAVRKEYATITSIHIYSLSPGKLQDLQVLTDIGQGLFTDVSSKEDALLHSKTYGVIQNPFVQRRKGKRPSNIDAPQAKVQPAKTTSTNKSGSGAKKEDTATNPRPTSKEGVSATESKSKPSLKKDASSLFKAFAKQSSKPKLERKDTDNSAASASEDVQMNDADQEGESEDEALFLDTNTRKGPKKRASEVRKEKDERAAKLRKMMDSDDEADDDEANKQANAETATQESGAKETAGGEEEDVAWSDSDAERERAKPADDTPAAEPRRRRGKKKVIKKRTMKDEDGYLVTREEEVWESFSEDEPEPKKEAAKPKSSLPPATKSQKATPTSSSTTSATGDAQSGGKKNIMSFFGRKNQ